MDPVAAGTVSEALFTRPDSTMLLHEPRTLAQRRADRLTDICHHALHPDHPDEPGDPDNTAAGDPDDTHPDTVADVGDPVTDPDTADPGDPVTDPDAADPGDPDNNEDGGGVGPGWGLGPVSRRPRRRGLRGGSSSVTDVIIDVETLAGGNPTVVERLRSELASGAPVTGPALDRLLCDTAFRALITDGPRTVLAYNRATPAIPPGLRRAVKARDQQCVFPGVWQIAHLVRAASRDPPATGEDQPTTTTWCCCAASTTDSSTTEAGTWPEPPTAPSPPPAPNPHPQQTARGCKRSQHGKPRTGTHPTRGTPAPTVLRIGASAPGGPPRLGVSWPWGARSGGLQSVRLPAAGFQGGGAPARRAPADGASLWGTAGETLRVVPPPGRGADGGASSRLDGERERRTVVQGALRVPLSGPGGDVALLDDEP